MELCHYVCVCVGECGYVSWGVCECELGSVCIWVGECVCVSWGVCESETYTTLKQTEVLHQSGLLSLKITLAANSLWLSISQFRRPETSKGWIWIWGEQIFCYGFGFLQRFPVWSSAVSLYPPSAKSSFPPSQRQTLYILRSSPIIAPRELFPFLLSFLQATANPCLHFQLLCKWQPRLAVFTIPQSSECPLKILNTSSENLSTIVTLIYEWTNLSCKKVDCWYPVHTGGEHWYWY